jgi:molecular chaperone GrpE
MSGDESTNMGDLNDKDGNRDKKGEEYELKEAVDVARVANIDLSESSQFEAAEGGIPLFENMQGDSRCDILPEILEKESRIKELLKEVAQANDRHLRLLAEFDNYKKNAAKQRAELLKYQGQAIISDLLNVLDTFEYALATPEGGDTSSFRDGVIMIRKNFLDTLEKWGIRAESSVGKPFDPAIHSALSMIESSDYEAGTVASEFKRAFYYKDRLMRPAEVVVVKDRVTDEV